MFCGVAKAEFLEEEAPKLDEWLRNNYNGKMAYMENTIEKLNGVIIEHADLFDVLRKDVVFLKERLFHLEQGGEQQVEPPPPHY